MNQERQTRNIGDIIELGGIRYQIEKLTGRGGSCIVYQASYRDGLNKENTHQVLIKELFPYSQRGEIHRGEGGQILVEEAGRELMEQSRDSFLQGNRANLELLRKDPEQISGNLNSFEAYGTYYTVLPVHGGKSLETLLEEGKYRSLPAAADAMMKLLDALECFHGEGILHLDISPDNILMLKKQALLIDYNSTWDMSRPADAPFYFSEKEGYSAPEICLRNRGAISQATDLYSVCAVFFRMVVGRRMTYEESMGKGLRRSFPKSLESFQGQPVTAIYKAVQILTKGLNILAGRRYQCITELKYDIRELKARLEGKGISASALWESSRMAYLAEKQPDGRYLPRTVCVKSHLGGSHPEQPEGTDGGQGELSETALTERMAGGGKLLLTGTGGMGKTQYLHRLWGEGVKAYKPAAPVILYIPLEDYQQSAGTADYIRHFLLRNLKFSEEINSMEDAFHELNRIIAEAGKKEPRILLLLDGLNEAGSQRQNLLREIEELGRNDGVGILVTDRTDAVKQYGLPGFETAILTPLADEAVKEELGRYGLESPGEQSLKELLRNPMMLSLYRDASVMSMENGGEALQKTPATLDEMVEFYIASLERVQKRKNSGNEAVQLAQSYLLEQFLPFVAGELKKKKKTVLSMEELYSLAGQDYRRMKTRSFGLAFPQYLGKSRLILDGIANDREWFDYAVSEQLTGQMNLMERTAEGNYRLIHDNFAGYFAGKWEDNQKAWKKQQRRFALKRGAFVLAAILILGVAGAAYRGLRPAERVISEEERKELTGAATCLNGNVGCWSSLMEGQRRLLETAREEDVLSNTQLGRDSLKEAITLTRDQATRSYQEFYTAPYNDRRSYLEIVQNIFPEISKEALNDVYTEAEVQIKNLLFCMDTLEERLCDEDSGRFLSARGDRETILSVYEDYLDASTEYYYVIYNEVYSILDEETQEELKEQIRELASFPPKTMNWSLGAKTEEELEDYYYSVVEKDGSRLKSVKLDMARWNFDVDAMEWPF